MATQKKTTAKKSSKSKKNSKSSNIDSALQGFGPIVGGWFMLALGAILVVGCLCSVHGDSQENFMGPILGKLLPNALSFFFGRVSALLVGLAIAFWGAILAFESLRTRGIRFAVGLTLLAVDLSLLFSLQGYGETGLSKEVLSQNGGVFGQFFTQNLMLPFFGPTSVVMPLAILLGVFVIILVLAFGLRPRHFVFMVQTSRWLKSQFKKKEPLEGELVNFDKGMRTNIPLEQSLPPGVYMDDKTVMINRDNLKIRHKGKVSPFNGRNNWMNDDLTINEVPEVPEEAVAEKTEPAPILAAYLAPSEPTLNVAGEYNMNEDPEIRRLQDYLRLNGHKMNALEVVEVKEKIAALRRARDLIAWEKGHRGRMQVKGDVRRTRATASLETATLDAAAMAATVAEKTRVAPQVAVEPEAEKTQTAVDAASLLGGDGAFVEAGRSTDDDTFVPEVYGACEGDSEGAANGTFANEEQLGETNGDAFGSEQTLGPFDGIQKQGSAAPIPQRDPTTAYEEYKVPVITDILDEHEAQTADYTEEELNAIGKMLEEKLENFKVKGRVIGCETGPMITRFEVEPGPGVKVSRFSALQEDLALPLKVSSVRILAPIPGKAAVGIEIPNRKFQTVFSRDVFQSESFKSSPEKILVALGKDITGEAFTMDLAKAPHLLIAGQTGSGKSVCINALMASMLFSKTPDELRMILVDPKAVELKMYESIPHLLAPVITKPEIAIQALQWLCYEMDRRTEVLATAKVRNIGGFNAKFEAGDLPEDVPSEDRSHRMAFIVVVIDEMADLMMVAGKEIEKSVARLAAKARAVGIHLVLATQRPSVKVITGIIKANLPTRISFKVASQIDARTVMDHAGAEKLLGRGDMLYKAVNDPEPVRVHGAFLSDEEAERLADACSDQNVFYPQVESFDVEEGNNEGDEEGGGKKLGKLDDKLFEVAQWAIDCRGLSTSAVQRHFSVGFSRAGKIVDQLYGLGVCGPSKGNSKPRAMLIGIDELLQMERSGAFRS